MTNRQPKFGYGTSYLADGGLAEVGRADGGLAYGLTVALSAGIPPEAIA